MRGSFGEEHEALRAREVEGGSWWDGATSGRCEGNTEEGTVMGQAGAGGG